ncbi:MAG: DUF5687 family protein [Bacteroidota bacterium]|jgi:Family of unknown function (DUF5687)
MPTPSIYLSLITHHWKQTIRSSYFEKGILMRIFLGLMFLYLAINLFIVGLFMGKMLSQAFPDEDLAFAFSRILFYYFIVDFLVRFFFQPLPVISIIPYLHLPLKRSGLFNFLLIKSGLSLFNFLPLLILVPFVLRSVLPDSEGGFALFLPLTVMLLVFSNNFLVFIIKKTYALRSITMFIVLAAAALLILADVKTNFLLSRGFASAITGIAQNAYLLLVPLALLIVMYLASRIFLDKNRYIELSAKKEKLLFSGNKRSFLDSFGIAGSQVVMEIKLILRNNRPRKVFSMSWIFLLYGFFIYGPHRQSSGTGLYLLVGLIMTGIIMFQYGQMVMSWESGFFDKICTSGLRMQDYFRGKFWFFLAANSISFIITLPFAFYGLRIAFINLAAFLFNSGINSFLILFLGTCNSRRIDLSKGAFFNYEGMSLVNFFYFFPMIGIPFFIYLPFSILGHPAWGLSAIGLAGITGLAFSGVFIRSIVKQFNSRKYKILNGFRTS